MRSSNGSLKLFVGDLGNNRKSDLNRLFSKYGDISTIYVDESKHFAFVEFTSTTDAQRALKHTNNKTVNGSKLRVEYAKPDKVSRDHRRPSSRDRSPTAILYSHLQVTANRLPPMQVFRQSYYQHHSMTTIPHISSVTSRGRSLTPPSFKQNVRPLPMHHLRSQDLYYQHPNIYSDPNYYRSYPDPYLFQRLPQTDIYRPTSPVSSSRSYRYMPSSSSSMNHRSSNMSSSHAHRRSRSPRRMLSSRRNHSSRERKRKRRTSSSSSTTSSQQQQQQQQHERGPRTPPPLKSSHRSRKRSHSDSDAIASISERKCSPNSTTLEDEENEEKSSNSKLSNVDSNKKHSKRKVKE